MLPSDSPRLYAALTYDDAAAAIDWLCGAFGFERRLVVPGDGRAIRHSELSLGPELVIFVSSPKPEGARVSPRGLSGRHAALCVWIPDPDAHCARARAAGARIVREPQDEHYGGRGYAAEDPEGHQWYFGTYRPGEHWTT